MTSESFDLETLRTLVGDTSAPFTMTVRAFLPLSTEGEYWFSVFSDDETCLAIDQQVVLGCQRGLNEGMALLHRRTSLRFQIRPSTRNAAAGIVLASTRNKTVHEFPAASVGQARYRLTRKGVLPQNRIPGDAIPGDATPVTSTPTTRLVQCRHAIPRNIAALSNEPRAHRPRRVESVGLRQRPGQCRSDPAASTM